MPKKTPLYQSHEALNAKIVDFHGWLLPIHYGSQLQEHEAVRKHAGMFDVSHMNTIEVTGEQAESFLRYLLANDVAKLSDGKALYSLMLNESGGIIDDLIVYRIQPNVFRVVLNAATREHDMQWIMQQAKSFDVHIESLSDVVNIAVQGPKARELSIPCLPAELRSLAKVLKPFSCVVQNGWQVSRTGYTGEDGFEILLPISEAADVWQSLIDQGIAPCGLGARDTLRLEAGLNLYGNDMDESVSPYAANVAWTLSMTDDRDFLGKIALLSQKETETQQLLGLVLLDRGVPRAEQLIYINDQQVGVLTSGTFSPTLQRGIGFARVASTCQADDLCVCDIRGKRIESRLVKLPFVRHGKIKIDLPEN